MPAILAAVRIFNLTFWVLQRMRQSHMCGKRGNSMDLILFGDLRFGHHLLYNFWIGICPERKWYALFGKLGLGLGHARIYGFFPIKSPGKRFMQY